MPATPQPQRKYGLIRDLADDGRDYRFSPPVETIAALPAELHADKICPPRMDQGSEGSCTANGTLGAMGLIEIKLYGDGGYVQRSRQELYYKTREQEGNTGEDAGGQIRDALRAAARFGIAPESLWPYTPVNLTREPPAEVIAAGAGYKLGLYERVQPDMDHIRAALAAGHPLVIGVAVYESFESQAVAKTGILPMPDTEREKCLGGHCLFLCGYSDQTQRARGSNSWGLGWGDKGMFEIPYAYLTNTDLCSDIWALKALALASAAN